MRKKRNAFTLVELLIALLVALLIAAAAGAVLQAGFAAWTRLVVGSRSGLETVRLLARLECDVASALPSAGQPFSGSADACEFGRLATPGRDAAPSAPLRVRWRWDAGSSTVLRMELAADGEEALPGTLLRFGPVPELRFRYAEEPGDAESAGDWQDTWFANAVTNLPAAVRVETGVAARRMVCRLRAAPPRLSPYSGPEGSGGAAANGARRPGARIREVRP